MLGEPATSPYDLHFQIFNFQVRISWTFWLVTPLLGWNSCNSLDNLAVRMELDSPGAAAILAIWVAVVFVSILIHELGHTFANRYFGIDSHIVLYHFGGLAIPSGSFGWSKGRGRRANQWTQLIVSAAGPAFQLLLAAIVAGLAMTAGVSLGFGDTILEWAGVDYQGRMPGNIALFALVDFLLWVNIAWAILNLMPILPLDGGNIARELMRNGRVNNAEMNAYLLSTVAAALLAVWAFSRGNQMMGFFFAVFGITNFQTLQSYNGRSGWN